MPFHDRRATSTSGRAARHARPIGRCCSPCPAGWTRWCCSTPWPPSRRERIAAVATFDHATGAHSRSAAAHRARGCAERVGCRGDWAHADRRRSARMAARRRGATARHALPRATPRARVGARVATAHTRDDQIETVLMRVHARQRARAGWPALAAPSADRAAVPRAVERSTLEAYAAARGVTWVEDPSNARRDVPAQPRAPRDAAGAAPRRPVDRRGAAGDRRRARRAGGPRSRRSSTRACATASSDEQTLVVAASELAGYDRDSLSRAVGCARGARRAGARPARNHAVRRVYNEEPESRARFRSSGGWQLEASTRRARAAPRRADGVRASRRCRTTGR